MGSCSQSHRAFQIAMQSDSRVAFRGYEWDLALEGATRFPATRVAAGKPGAERSSRSAVPTPCVLTRLAILRRPCLLLSVYCRGAYLEQRSCLGNIAITDIDRTLDNFFFHAPQWSHALG